jgi:plastocyanin
LGIIKEVNTQSKKTTLVIGSFAVMAAAIIFGVIYLSGAYLDKRSANEGIANCKSRGVTRMVVIQDSRISPEHTEASLCDTLKITNNDDQNRLVAFGTHDHHVAYNGITQELLGKDKSMKVTLNEQGTYEFHDHFEAAVAGFVTIN